MVMGKGIVVRGTGEIIEVGLAELTSLGIEKMSEQIQLAERLVATVMEEGIDFGNTPGTQGKGLWDPGAAKVIRAFGLHTKHDVIFHEESDNLISWTIQCSLVDGDGHIVGSGLGAASTRETKYKYRWVEKPEEFGYSPEEIDDMKTRPGYGDKTVYRIENPEYGELINTLLQMAAKRSEVDSARSLPGVGAALRREFDAKLKAKGKPTVPPTAGGPPDFSHFWTTIKAWGISEAATHQILGVTSTKEWIAAGHTLDEAINKIAKVFVDAARKTAAAKNPSLAKKTAASITAEDCKTTDDLIALCEKFWQMNPEEPFLELGYSSWQNFEETLAQTPFEAFQAIQASKSA